MSDLSNMFPLKHHGNKSYTQILTAKTLCWNSLILCLSMPRPAAGNSDFCQEIHVP